MPKMFFYITKNKPYYNKKGSFLIEEALRLVGN